MNHAILRCDVVDGHSSTPMLLRVDAHAHVFRRDLPLVTPRRYTPAYDATSEALLAHLDANGLQMVLLTQPSFLGTDNSHMLQAVAGSRGRMRAVVAVDDSIEESELDAMQTAGAVGIRFNLASVIAPDFAAGRWPRILSMLRQRDWHVEVFGRAEQLSSVLEPVLDAGVRICVDHFGHPDPVALTDDPGFRYLLSQADSGRIWIKLSAAYRSGGVEGGEQTALAVTPALLDAFGPTRLLWGSDWPHTQHESLVTYESTFAALRRWVPDEEARETILTTSAHELLTLSSPAA